ncbi:MAG: hypothetical protein RDV48_30935 [Candidatus Eremiobacteraeota bacterium]|nr:hypothetical protein [Candidatus Eremiobacteraeota bacterium]
MDKREANRLMISFNSPVDRDRIIGELPKLLQILTESEVSLDIVYNENHELESYKLESPYCIEPNEKPKPLIELIKSFILMEMWGTAVSSSVMLKFLFFELVTALEGFSGRSEEDVYIDIGHIVQKRLESIRRFKEGKP